MKARDVFRAKIRELGIDEAYLWGKGEIEDMLFQPKSDHLLFAYFGISLRMRQQALRASVRARLATKRKAVRTIDKKHQPVLIRDASDDTYPYLNGRTMTGSNPPPWRVFSNGECRHDGIHLPMRRYMAFIDDDGESWDFAEKMNDSIAEHYNPWFTKKDRRLIDAREAGRDEASAIWDALPEQNKAWLEIFAILPYENIVAIDEEGDEHFRYAHIFTIPFTRAHDPFREYQERRLEGIGYDRRRVHTKQEKRVAKFPRLDDGTDPE
jgi:hypothetical protein